jgi:HTH-type transcriptional regulator, glycine betaine synthesis regulator
MSTWRDRVSQALGDAASRSGVLSETAGKIFAVLYLSPGPLSLDELSREVGTSKGNASVQVRELLELGMVRKVWVRRSRRDYYEAVTDLWTIAAEVIGRRLEQEARSLLAAVSEAERELPDAAGDLVKGRVMSMRLFLELVAVGIEGFRRGEVMSPDGLRKLAG